jgi:hypothetical protein
LSSAAIEKHPDEIWEADNKQYLEPLEFHSGNKIFLWPRIGVSSGCDRFLHFSFPRFVRPDQQPSIALVLPMVNIFRGALNSVALPQMQ